MQLRDQNSRVGSCMWCLFEAHTEANVGRGATVRFRGYTQAVSQHFVKRNAGKSLKVGARALKKTHRHFVSTGSVMQAMYRMLHLGTPHKITQKQFDEAALQTGCKGLTAFAALPYVDLSCLFTVSTGHALLFGVVSDFVDYTLRSLKDIKPADPDAKLVMSREARQRVTARGQFLVVTSDFGRRYKCIMQYRKSYRMEDWLHFVETFSSYIFKGDVLPEALRALCWSLCSTVTHYFRLRPPDETREQFLVAAKAAAYKLRAYTTRLEELEVPGYMFTVNLHICVCWLYSDLPARSLLRAEALDEEQYFGAEYGRQQQRISCWACYQAEVGNETRTYAAYLKHFVHLPAEDGAQDVRFTVADVYSGQVFSEGLVVVNMAAAQTARAGSQWEMWQDLGLPLSELKGKFCTAAPEGDRKGLIKSYRMEDWLHFVETFSSYIFKGDVLPEALRALCWSLCSTVTHYFRLRPPDETREQFLVAAKAAAYKLRAYTTRLEELEVPGYMFTVNLHICVCWLYSDLPARSLLRAEALDEEQYFGAEYGRQQQRISCWACYQAEVGNETRTYAAYLKHFVHLPAEDGAQDVRFTVADVYSGQVFSEGLVVVNMAAAQTARAGSQWEMWQDLGLPLTPATLHSIRNKKEGNG
ncbi:hypothetical protein VOLCADRAFT_92673 [Volvox carteri f. nagariensis]|uniref:Uncharacterized protein n=1 Tax=Volvox carteri f. nagariensis TaxID=3068 RepID=D8U084_VOLCA|nr:uncharacterized protein VOLCADRAFT_92673 [Volvox carteri f. nagariensis]EFJ46897.1 hypothetical protein VOLCADRAFT_92673 [Volvox carteri f. nagariensis]|eukprot:XP_002952106.1 hypothetical protein VOLCADRAFT_92673 [Volvox carteri f. nagariensis]